MLTRHLLRLPINCLVSWCLPTSQLATFLSHNSDNLPWQYRRRPWWWMWWREGWRWRSPGPFCLNTQCQSEVWNKARSHRLQVLTFYHCIIWNNARYISNITGHSTTDTAAAARCSQNISTIHGDWSHQVGQEDIVPLRTAEGTVHTATADMMISSLDMHLILDNIGGWNSEKI